MVLTIRFFRDKFENIYLVHNKRRKKKTKLCKNITARLSENIYQLKYSYVLPGNALLFEVVIRLPFFA